MAETGTPHPDLLTMRYNSLIRESAALKQLASDRKLFRAPTPPLQSLGPGGPLTREERARFVALDNAINVHHGVWALQGRPLSDFGFEGADQAHGQSEGFACGCTLHRIIDHNRRFESNVEHHPHYPMAVCTKHASLLPDFKAHYAQVVSDHAV
jgi:hypothetical protein